MTWNILFERMRYILWPNLIHYSREPTSRELVRREPLEKKRVGFYENTLILTIAAAEGFLANQICP